MLQTWGPGLFHNYFQPGMNFGEAVAEASVESLRRFARRADRRHRDDAGETSPGHCATLC
jgi:hypothetical protein